MFCCVGNIHSNAEMFRGYKVCCWLGLVSEPITSTGRQAQSAKHAAVGPRQRTWCVRPVTGVKSTLVRSASLLNRSHRVSAGFPFSSSNICQVFQEWYEKYTTCSSQFLLGSHGSYTQGFCHGIQVRNIAIDLTERPTFYISKW